MFLKESEISHVYLHIDFVDFRKGILGLCGHVTHEFSASSESANLFVFCNKSRDKIRVLYWDSTGFALWHKALERNKFKWPACNTGEWKVNVIQLKKILSGLSIVAEKKHEKIDAKLTF